MPTRYVIDGKQSVVFTYFEGRLTVAEVAAHAAQLSRDPEFKPEFTELVDLREVTEPAIDAEGFISVSSLDPFSKTSKRAFVAGEGVTYGVTRMFQILRDNSYIEVFFSIEEARRWLGLEETAPPAG